jgi:methyl-accepting chemotaxis protein WspA
VIGFQRLGLRAKMAVLLGVFLAAFAAFATVALRLMNTVKVNGPVYHRIVQGKDVIADVLPPPEYIIESYLLVLQLERTTDPTVTAQLIERGKGLRREYDVRHQFWIEDLDPGTLKDKMVGESYRPAIQFFEVRDGEFVPALLAGQRERATEIVTTKLHPLYEEHRRVVDEIVRMATESNQRFEREAAEIVESSRRILILLGFAVVAIVFLISWVTTRITSSLTRRIQLATSAAAKVAGGDLTAELPVSGEDETGRLLDAIREMTRSLNALVARVKRSSIDLMSTATQFAATSKQQETTVNSFGASTTEIAAAVREISATSQELLTTMEGVNSVAAETARLAEHGREGLSEMDSTMEQLTSSTTSISAKLSVIREKAADINTVVTTITKVADQTNLLSVNAAIEAEKAGEFGLGFLVLAREIRRLADQTAVATLDIEQMVRQMQAAVSAGVMEMDKFSEEVRRGVSHVEAVGGQVGQIIAQVQSLSQRFDSVNDGMRAQSLGARQINEAMVQLTDGARHTSGSLKEFNSATEHLREAIQGLREEVSRFTVTG